MIRWARGLPGLPVARETLVVALPAAMVCVAAEKPGFALVSALVACVVLLARNAWPAVVVLLCLPALGGGLGWAPAVVALFALGRTYPCRWLVASVPVIALAPLLPVVLVQSLGPGAIALTVCFVLVCVSAPVALGALVATHLQLTTSLRRLRAATESEALARAETARAEERSRIAREVHDAVGHHVTLMAVEAAALAATTKDQAARESATRLRGQAKEAVEEMRATLGLGGTHRSETGLRTIPDLVNRAREAGLRVDLRWHVDEDREIAPGIARAAHRVVQEALTNVSKHAPGANAEVQISCEDAQLSVSVINDVPNGDGVETGRGGSGLEGLAERVRTVGGQLTARAGADGAFELIAVLPSAGVPTRAEVPDA